MPDNEYRAEQHIKHHTKTQCSGIEDVWFVPYTYGKRIKHKVSAGKKGHQTDQPYHLAVFDMNDQRECRDAQHKNGNNESKLDIIANAVSYATLLENHIHKEDNVIFNFAKRALSKEILKTVDKQCMEYEENSKDVIKENLDILTYLEEKYI